MIDAITGTESLPVLERLMQFAGQRHRLLVNNIANLDTPGFRPLDVSVEEFRQNLRDAIDRRDDPAAPLEPRDTAEVEFHEGGLTLRPAPAGDNILFHDGNDRDLDRTMADLAENFMTFRLASELLRNQLAVINAAIRERP